MGLAADALEARQKFMGGKGVEGVRSADFRVRMRPIRHARVPCSAKTVFTCCCAGGEYIKKFKR